MSQQAFGIIPKVKEVDDLLRGRPTLGEMIYEVHPELCFSELEGAPLRNPKKSPAGRVERQSALRSHFVNLEQLDALRRLRHIESVDFLDAAAACWSGDRIHRGIAKTYGDTNSRDACGLPMVIWA
jgi:predicted RNase H-like nuclease